MDIRSFIQTSSSTTAAANATLRLQNEAAGYERLQASGIRAAGY